MKKVYLLLTLLLSMMSATASFQSARATEFSHAKFDTLLKRHVADGKVNYKALKQDKLLDEYLSDLSRANPNALGSRDEKIAFWINAYNAYTLKLIVDNYPLKSIKDLSFLGTIVINSPWKKEFCNIGGKLYSLDAIEHDILRGEFGEERIHFAVNCASESCPILRNEAYSPSKLKAQLEEQARTFLGDGVRNQMRWEGKTLYLSQIFNWYRGDFEKKSGSLEAYLAQFFTDEQKRWLAAGEVKIEFLDYDWSLNEQP